MAKSGKSANNGVQRKFKGSYDDFLAMVMRDGKPDGEPKPEISVHVSSSTQPDPKSAIPARDDYFKDETTQKPVNGSWRLTMEQVRTGEIFPPREQRVKHNGMEQHGRSPERR